MARPPLATANPEEVSRALDEARTQALESKLGDEFTPKFQAGLLKTAFPNDAAEIDREFARQDAPYRVRGFEKTSAGGYRITASNGREFTITTTANASVLRVNGQDLDYSKSSLKSFAERYAKALHRTFVVRHFPLSLFVVDSAHAYVQGLLAAIVVGLFVVYSKWSEGSFPARVARGFINLASVCEADRASNLPFEKSASGTAYLELMRKEIALNVEDEGCEQKVAITSVNIGDSKPRFSDKERQKACEARQQFISCVNTYRGERDPSSNVRMIEKSTPSFN